MSWRDTLATLQRQFEACAERSSGLHHLLVEVADDERERMKGPSWFVDHNPFLAGDSTIPQSGPWHMVQSSGLPWVHPRYRKVEPNEKLENIPQERIIRDRTGRPQAVFEPMRLRQSYLCGDQTQLASFGSLSEAASRALTDVPELMEHEYGRDLADLFRKPRGGIRYVFGDVPTRPSQFCASGWNAGMLVYESGVLIDVPISEDPPGMEHWLLFLHRLSWRRIPGCPLQGKRLGWHGNTTVPFDWIMQQRFDIDFPSQWRKTFLQIPTTSYYSILGAQERPLDVCLASAFAIQLLLSGKTEARKSQAVTAASVDYSTQPWFQLKLPEFEAVTRQDCKNSVTPRIVILTATVIERDTVLKYMTPIKGRSGVLRLFDEKNTSFIGNLGKLPIILTMCEIGSSGRDSAQTVAGEMISTWKPIAIIMVGIAFGRGEERQKIGDVLVADRIISYEPARLGTEATIARGNHYSVGPTLLNRFRNAVGWSFVNPAGAACDMHFGPMLSGEKLIDNIEFKENLFVEFPNAIGGEMEGAGLAAAAERSKCEWILVKGICDWADGTKNKQHQGFASASAVSLVQFVLNQPCVL